MQVETKGALSLVITKYKRLKENRFVKLIEKQKHGLHLSWAVEEPFRITRTGVPEQESIEAFALNLRFFLQDNEPCSFRNLARLLDGDDVSQRWKSEFTILRDRLNSFLDSPLPLAMSLDGMGSSTYRWVLELCLYGDLAHSNRQKQTELQRWRDEPFFRPFIDYYFEETILALLIGISHLARISALEMGVEPN
jgi:hypothetical protein